MNNNCVRCNNWIVHNANYCHNCGIALSTAHTFESAVGSGGGAMRSNGSSNTNWRLHVANAFILCAGAIVGVLFAEWSVAWIMLSLIGYVAVPALWRGVLILADRAPRFKLSNDTTTLKVEHFETTSSGERTVLLSELPRQITLAKLQHVARIVLESPIGSGKQFSRPNVQQHGVFSQNDYKILRDHWLESRHCYWLNTAVPQQGVALTERCKRLLRKTIALIR